MNDKPRLIDANALKKELDAWASPIRNRKFYVRDDAICVIDAAPTVDAVPVVRCGKCINYSHGDCICSLKDGSWGENDFCSDGTMHY